MCRKGAELEKAVAGVPKAKRKKNQLFALQCFASVLTFVSVRVSSPRSAESRQRVLFEVTQFSAVRRGRGKSLPDKTPKHQPPPQKKKKKTLK